MTLIIDPRERTLAASVRDLAAGVSQRAIGLTGTGLTRLWIGQELHRRVQEELAAVEPGFEAEVSARLETAVDGWKVTVVGRADGVVRGDDGVVTRVDEIKTLHFAVDLHNLFASERLEQFRRQAALYAAMLSPPDRPAPARLLLVDIVTREEREEEVIWDHAAVEAWLRQAVRRVIAVELRRLARLDELREAAATLPFPHPEMRPAQRPMVDAVTGALGAERHLLLAAPTGAGKTAAVLHAALRMALSGGRRLFVLTAKTLQQRLAVDTVRAMQRDSFRSLQLRAKTKMCAHTEMVCHEEFCPYAEEYGLKLVRTQLLGSLLSGRPHLDPDEIFARSRAHQVCPFEVSLDLLGDVDVVVCDYNYVFDPQIGLANLVGDGALARAVLVVDEAHNLVERSRGYYSPALATPLLERALASLAGRDNELFRLLGGIVGSLRALVDDCVQETLGDREGEAPSSLPRRELADLRIELDGAMLQYFVYKREHELWSADDPVLEAFFTLTHLHRVLSLGGDEFVHLAARLPDGSRQIRIVCLDASRFLAEVLDECGGCVAMSATLEPFDFHRELLGFDPHRTDTLAVPSPFPADNRLVLAIDDVDTTWRRRGEHADAVAGWIASLSHPGRNVLVLFPSYAFLETVRDRLPALGHELVVQQRGASDAEQQALLEALAGGRDRLVLAVLGGILAEGVDYPGEMLSQVIVVSPGLPQYNLERELLKQYYRERYGRGFEYAYLVPGMTRVVQAAGRLIRSPEDRGVIALLCRRFLDHRYAALLPREWTGGDPESLRLPDPVAAVRSFFARSPAPASGVD